MCNTMSFSFFTQFTSSSLELDSVHCYVHVHASVCAQKPLTYVYYVRGNVLETLQRIVLHYFHQFSDRFPDLVEQWIFEERKEEDPGLLQEADIVCEASLQTDIVWRQQFLRPIPNPLSREHTITFLRTLWLDPCNPAFHLRIYMAMYGIQIITSGNVTRRTGNVKPYDSLCGSCCKERTIISL